MATKENDTCRETADRDDLERFTLHAKDVTAPKTICSWIRDNIETASPEKLHDALDCALRMRDYEFRKSPD